MKTQDTWISNQERLLELQTDCDPEPMKTILCHFIFVDTNQYIQKIAKEKAKISYNIDKDQHLVSKDQLLDMIQRQKIAMQNSKYIYKHACMFNVDLDPEDVQPFVDEDDEDNNEFFENISLMDDIVIDPSIFVFHQVNSLYFFFEEKVEPIEELKDVTKLKPILKIHPPVGETKSSSSKKVTIKLNRKPSTTRKNQNK